jgi:hypothetical protein
MSEMKKLIVSVALGLVSTVNLLAQGPEINGGPINVPSENIIDGVYIKEHVPTKRLIPYEFVREADVIWSRRVWRRIDLREKINHPLYFPPDEIMYPNQPEEEWVRNTNRWSLWTIMRHHVYNGDLILFSPFNPNDQARELLDGDLFKYPIKPAVGKNYYTDPEFKKVVEEYFAILGNSKFEPRIDPATGEQAYRMVWDDAAGDSIREDLFDTIRPKDWIISQHIVAYDLKEDWFFDKERSVMDVRILGISPVIYKAPPAFTMRSAPNNNNEGNGTLQNLFWLYFPHCRFVFNNYFAYNTKNDAQWMSFDDVFWKRQFSSYIFKESNVFDRKIESYRTGLDALHESNRITEEIRTIEHDVWHF